MFAQCSSLSVLYSALYAAEQCIEHCKVDCVHQVALCTLCTVHCSQKSKSQLVELSFAYYQIVEIAVPCKVDAVSYRISWECVARLNCASNVGDSPLSRQHPALFIFLQILNHVTVFVVLLDLHSVICQHVLTKCHYDSYDWHGHCLKGPDTVLPKKPSLWTKVGAGMQSLCSLMQLVVTGV